MTHTVELFGYTATLTADLDDGSWYVSSISSLNVKASIHRIKEYQVFLAAVTVRLEYLNSNA